jgi:hypothetical protein
MCDTVLCAGLVPGRLSVATNELLLVLSLLLSRELPSSQ